MIDQPLVVLSLGESSDGRLDRHEQLLGTAVRASIEVRVIEPLRAVFSSVVSYGFTKRFAEAGPAVVRREIRELVARVRPGIVLWLSSMYEIPEPSFEEIRALGARVVGWFFDDETRFDEYGRWWAPRLDHVLTCDAASVTRYEALGVPASFLPLTSSAATYRRLGLEKRFDVSFVGTAIADRRALVEELAGQGIRVATFGHGWTEGRVSTEEMVEIYNASRINLCFVKAYREEARPQLKNKIFDITMCGGFLLCERLPQLAEFFDEGREVATFATVRDAAERIRHYLAHQEEREHVAAAGWQRARAYDQATLLEPVFREIAAGPARRMAEAATTGPPPELRPFVAAYHRRWARALLAEGYPEERWAEELGLARFYGGTSLPTTLIGTLARAPEPIRRSALAAWERSELKVRDDLAITRWTARIARSAARLRGVRARAARLAVRTEEVWLLRRLHRAGHRRHLEVETHMTVPERLRLYALARRIRPGGVIVEVGSYLGASSLLLAAGAEEANATVYCVDTWQNDAMTEGRRDTYDQFLTNTGPHADRIRPLRGTSTEIAAGFDERIDLLFVDANHLYLPCRADLDLWLPKVRPGGTVAMHDIAWAEGVQWAAHECLEPRAGGSGRIVENLYWCRLDVDTPA